MHKLIPNANEAPSDFLYDGEQDMLKNHRGQPIPLRTLSRNDG